MAYVHHYFLHVCFEEAEGYRLIAWHFGEKSQKTQHRSLILYGTMMETREDEDLIY